MAEIKKREQKSKMTPEQIAERDRIIADLEKEGWEKPRQASGGDIIPWAKGLRVRGVVQRIKKLPGEDSGSLMEIKRVDADPDINGITEVYGCPTLLLQTLTPVPQGEILIYCLGQIVKTKRPENAWDFLVTSKDQGHLGV